MTTKYKNILFSGLLASVILVTTGCSLSEQEDYTGTSTLTASSPTVTIQADDFQNIPGVEKDETYTYTVTLSEPQIADVKIQVFQSGGTATEHEDFDLGEHTLTIPAYETSTTGSITTYADTDPEDSETLQITIGDETTANVIFTPQVYDFVLDNYEEVDLNITFDWDMGIEWNGNTYGTHDNIDLDFEVYDADGNFIADYQAQTGDTPETFLMTLEDYPNGTYHFYHFLWSNGFAGLDTDTLVPVTAICVQTGVFRETVVQMDTEAMNSDQLGYADDDSRPIVDGFVVSVTNTDGVWTISGELPTFPASKTIASKSRARNGNKVRIPAIK